MKRREALVGIGSMAVSTACGGSGSSPTAQEPEHVATPEPSHTLVGAGDIGWCGSPGMDITARLLDDIGGTVFTLGDNAYMNGSVVNFASCYEPTWGRHRSRTRPVLGNHDYLTRDGLPYFQYFGAAAGDPRYGYYEYTLGPWLVLALNTCVPCDRRSAQYAWARTRLESFPSRRIIAMWHHPLASSGRNGPNPFIRDLWELMHLHRVPLVLNGHDHWYERCEPMNGLGKADPTGPLQLTVGTGGANLYTEDRALPISARRIPAEFGVARLDLFESRVRWQFIADGGHVLDSGERLVV